MDWCVGEVIKVLEVYDIFDEILIIYISDNGFVVDDGYYDDVVEKFGEY